MSVDADGTLTAVISTEHTLATIAVAGDYVFIVDTVNLASGDTVELRIKNRVLSGGTTRGYIVWPYSGAQSVDTVIKCSIPFRVEHNAALTLKQTAGTGRQFPWALWRIAN